MPSNEPERVPRVELESPVSPPTLIFACKSQVSKFVVTPNSVYRERQLLNKERADLQRWIEQYPEIIEPDLLVITTEFDQWQIRERRVADRLDILFLDSDGSLLVAELKRDEAPDTTDLQVLKYAAYSQLTVEDVVEQYSRYHQVEVDSARAAILEHAPSLTDRELGSIRAKIVAGSFGASVTHVVLFLNDIGCVQVSAVVDSSGRAVLSSRQLLPPPAAEDYLVKRRRKESEEIERDSATRRRNTVTILEDLGFSPGAIAGQDY